MEDAVGPPVEWRSLAEAVPGGVAIQRDGRFAYVSADAAALLGAGGSSPVDEPWTSPIADAERDRLEAAIDDARSGEQWEGVVALADASGTDASERPADGTPGAISLTLTRADPDAVVWTVADAPAAAANESHRVDVASADGDGSATVEGNDDGSADPSHRLLERPRFVRALLDAIDDVVYVMGDEGPLVLWNDALCEVTGYSDDALAAMNPLDLVPEDHHDRVPRVGGSIDDAGDQVIEVDLLTADGERITHEFAATTIEDPETGETLRCGTARDLTERLERERELERQATILDTIEDGVYAIDANLEFTYVNEGFADLAGVPRAELLGTHALELFPDEQEHEIAASIREQAVADGDDGGTLEATLPSPDGDRHVESRFRLHPEPDGGEFRGSVGVLRDVTEFRALRRELEEEHRFLQNVVDAMDDVLYVVDEHGDFVFWNDVATDRFGYTDAEFADLDPATFLSEEDRDVLEPFDVTALPERHRVELVTADGTVIPHALHGVTYREEETGERYRVGVARDVTRQLERERELERQRDELATLDRINEVILETVQELLTSGNRDAVERAVCDRLADSALYQFAWVGERELDGDRIVPRVVAGADRGYVDDVTVTADGPTGNGPIGRAMRTGAVQVANVEDPEFAPWRDLASERGVESVLAVPLHHDETVYGVLAVYANREDAFSARERAAFDVLGRAVGFVFHAARSRELLFADEIIELEFSLRTAESLFGEAGPALDCELDLAGYVASGEQWILYVEVRDIDPAEMVAYANEDTVVEDARVINETAAGGRLEVVVGESDLFETVSAAGATVRSATATPTSAKLVVEAPIGADVRDVVEIVTREYTGADLVARREREREITSPTRPEGILGDLTDRQRSVLQTAYRAGYFDWPRESTAEQVADSLDVAPATLHGHLRKAEKAVLAAMFEEL